MEINVNRDVFSAGSIRSDRAAGSKTEIQASGNLPEDSEALKTRLTRLPDVRHDVVERGRKLLGDPGYPPPRTVQEIARLLAAKLNPRKGGEKK